MGWRVGRRRPGVLCTQRGAVILSAAWRVRWAGWEGGGWRAGEGWGVHRGLVDYRARRNWPDLWLVSERRRLRVTGAGGHIAVQCGALWVPGLVGPGGHFAGSSGALWSWGRCGAGGIPGSSCREVPRPLGSWSLGTSRNWTGHCDTREPETRALQFLHELEELHGYVRSFVASPRERPPYPASCSGVTGAAADWKNDSGAGTWQGACLCVRGS